MYYTLKTLAISHCYPYLSDDSLSFDRLQGPCHTVYSPLSLLQLNSHLFKALYPHIVSPPEDPSSISVSVSHKEWHYSHPHSVGCLTVHLTQFQPAVVTLSPKTKDISRDIYRTCKKSNIIKRIKLITSKSQKYHFPKIRLPTCVLTTYRRSGFDCEILMIANCEFF